MKVTDEDNGSYLIEPEQESLDDIAVALILASYEDAIPFGHGLMRAHDTVLTKEMALEMLQGKDISSDYCSNPNKPDKVAMDYVFGRCCKTSVVVDREKSCINLYIGTRDRNPKAILKLAKQKLNG